MISSLNLKKRNIWKYDPYHLVSKQCKTLNSTPYIHHSNHEIERIANKDTWEEVQSLMKNIGSRYGSEREA
jgi:hypothetical protein